MPRASLSFQSVFDACCRNGGYSRTTIDNDTGLLKQKWLDIFNRAYEIGYDVPGKGWEDARTGATVEPVSLVISWDVIGDAREFDVWEDDPRDVDGSQRIAFDTDLSGIRLLSDIESVWVRWIPETVEFTTTAWAGSSHAYVVGDTVLHGDDCYRCLVAHSSATFATELAASKWVLMPVLAVLKEFLIAYTKGTWLSEHAGKPDEGSKLQALALDRLEDKVLAELGRNSRGGVAETSGASNGTATPTQKYLRFDTDQTLSTLQQLQALENAGVTIAADGTLLFPGGFWITLNAA